MTLAQWLARPDRNRLHVRREREYQTDFTLDIDLRRDCTLYVSIGSHGFRLWWGHAYDCGCNACIPF